MKVFTVSNGKVEVGAKVESLRLFGAGVEIPAIIIGESGRGRSLGVLPVAGVPNIPSSEGETFARLMTATVGTTRSGAPKLIAADDPGDESGVIIVFRTEPGYRGRSSHTGDRSGWKCRTNGCDGAGTDRVPPAACPVCGSGDRFEVEAPIPVFADWPGKNLVRGYVAQGAAGRAGGGEQLVSIMPRGVVFRTFYGGRLYGKPPSHYYLFDGNVVLSATWEDRMVSDAF